MVAILSASHVVFCPCSPRQEDSRRKV